MCPSTPPTPPPLRAGTDYFCLSILTLAGDLSHSSAAIFNPLNAYSRSNDLSPRCCSRWAATHRGIVKLSPGLNPVPPPVAIRICAACIGPKHLCRPCLPDLPKIVQGNDLTNRRCSSDRNGGRLGFFMASFLTVMFRSLIPRAFSLILPPDIPTD